MPEIEAPDNIRGFTLLPVITAALMPTAKLLGKELREYVGGSIDRAKERARVANLENHLSRNQERLQNRPTNEKNLDDASSIELFAKWVDAVQDVDANDPQISKLWDKILEDILQRNPLTDLLLSTLKSLNSSEIRLIMTIKRSRGKFLPRLLRGGGVSMNSDADQILARSLTEKGLVKKVFISPQVYMVTGYPLVIIAMLYAIDFRMSFSDYFSSVERYLPPMVLIALFLLFYVYLFMTPYYKLSSLGEALLAAVPAKKSTVDSVVDVPEGVTPAQDRASPKRRRRASARAG